MWRRVVSALGFILLLGCGAGDPDDAQETRADERTQAERDSILGESNLPGARAVQRARESANTANERAQRLDSIQR